MFKICEEKVVTTKLALEKAEAAVRMYAVVVQKEGGLRQGNLAALFMSQQQAVTFAKLRNADPGWVGKYSVHRVRVSEIGLEFEKEGTVYGD